MAGSMYRTPSGLWVLRVYAGRHPLTGRKVWKSGRSGDEARGRAGVGWVRHRTAGGARGGAVADLPRVAGALVRGHVGRLGSPSTAQQTR